MLTTDAVIAAVDPLGFRPLSVAKFGDGWLFASETCAFDLFGKDIVYHHALRETMMVHAGIIVHPLAAPDDEVTRHCSFEHVYFTRPDSIIFGQSAGAVKERLGAALAKAAPSKTDIVAAVPDSSNDMAQAYAETLGIPFRNALIRNHYTGRTFITPKQFARELGVRMKLNANRHVVRGKTLTVVDDSLVRGTTARKIVELLRAAGAKEVHLRIASPPVIHPCYWGIDTPSRQELIASQMDPAALASVLGADSLAYLTIEDLNAALEDPQGRRHCTTCFTGVAPAQGLMPADSLLKVRHKPT
jgi:amidophosphoribosyltransferase